MILNCCITYCCIYYVCNNLVALLKPVQYVRIKKYLFINKLCDAANSVQVYNLAFNAMFVVTNSVTSSA